MTDLVNMGISANYLQRRMGYQLSIVSTDQCLSALVDYDQNLQFSLEHFIESVVYTWYLVFCVLNPM